MSDKGPHISPSAPSHTEGGGGEGQLLAQTHTRHTGVPYLVNTGVPIHLQFQSALAVRFSRGGISRRTFRGRMASPFLLGRPQFGRNWIKTELLKRPGSPRAGRGGGLISEQVFKNPFSKVNSPTNLST